MDYVVGLDLFLIAVILSYFFLCNKKTAMEPINRSGYSTQKTKKFISRQIKNIGKTKKFDLVRQGLLN